MAKSNAKIASRRDEDMEVDRNESGEDMDMSEEEAENPPSEVLIEDEVVLSEEDAPEDGSEPNGGSEMDPEESSEGQSSAEEEEEEEDDGKDAQGDELSPTSSQASPSPPPPPSLVKHPRFKITLRLPSMSGNPSTNATPTPSDITLPPSRRAASRDIDIESEDSVDDDDTSTRSASIAGPSRMTHRQAALAGVVNTAEHVSLEEPVSKRKKLLNENELALRREETARKRKNLSEKKLEDEKAETINRLLKKQSRSRAKRTALANVEQDEEADVDGEEAIPAAQVPDAPTLFRWISSNKSGEQTLSLSIPVSLLSKNGEGGESMTTTEVSREQSPVMLEKKVLPICDVPGCAQPRKYKFVKDPVRGGCGMEHLKALQVI